MLYRTAFSVFLIRTVHRIVIEHLSPGAGCNLVFRLPCLRFSGLVNNTAPCRFSAGTVLPVFLTLGTGTRDPADKKNTERTSNCRKSAGCGIFPPGRKSSLEPGKLIRFIRPRSQKILKFRSVFPADRKTVRVENIIHVR